VVVDCDTCVVRGPACDDCVVTVLLGMPAPERPVELDPAEQAAIGVLAESGLVPPLRLLPHGGTRSVPPVPPGVRPYDDGRAGGRRPGGSARAG
jgi:hypothetical protein